MILHIFNNAEEIGKAVANLIVEQVNEKPDSVLGFATGASPVPTYQALIKAYNKGKVSFKDITTFNLDEYCDLPKDDKNSYYTFMHENLFNHIDVKEENVNFLNGNAEDTDAECTRYDDLLTENKIDIQLLGVGRNGHIGFNEPSNKFTKGSFKVRLSQSTIDANSVYFDEDTMPHYALTMGTVSIMKSKQIILIATGRSKSDAIYGLVNGDISPSCPASVLQLHPNVHIFLDKAAAARL
ncbi:MAG: glucosamine-6-phosphate deaminase [Clostridia bacterium]|nr:glucosamine-6-phosphate deaminase [Clostridia bacterium]MBR5543921.1 glucosamine-6-phosphate deaminase [Clostridia bacterium]